jgi:DNA-binding response OmpR family regulator
MPEQPSDPVRILIVDDDAVMRDMVANTLRRTTFASPWPLDDRGALTLALLDTLGWERPKVTEAGV